MTPFMNRIELVYQATGSTYNHREMFISWAWHWDPKRVAWINDSCSAPNDPAIMYFLDQERSDVHVRMCFIDSATENQIGFTELPFMTIPERSDPS